MLHVLGRGRGSAAAHAASEEVGLDPQPFASSAIARSALSRMLGVIVLILLLWAAAAWAVALP